MARGRQLVTVVLSAGLGWCTLAAPALGSRIYYRSLEDVAQGSSAVAVAKIESVNSTRGTFDVTYRFVARIEGWLYGTENADRIEADYVFYLPQVRAAPDGHSEMSVSPMESGSGLEESARPDERYLLLFGDRQADGGLRVLRIEPTEKSDEIGRLLVARFCARVESIETIEQAAAGLATVVDVDPMWILTLKVERVQGPTDRLAPGKSHRFAIHSSTRLFAAPAEEAKGRTYSFELAPVPMAPGRPAGQRFRLEVLPPSANDASGCRGDR